jgi:hypothetical protein
MNLAHRVNKHQRRLRSLHARIEAKEGELTALLRNTSDITSHQKRLVETELKTLRRQLANIL